MTPPTLDRVQGYLASTTQGLRHTTRSAVKEALVSVAQTTLLLSVGGLLGGLTLGAVTSQSPPHRAVSTLAGTLSLSLLGVGGVRSMDALADVEHAAWLNSSGTRNRATEKVFDAGLEYVTNQAYLTNVITTTGNERAWLEGLYLQGPSLPPHQQGENAQDWDGTDRRSPAPVPVDLADRLGRTPRSLIIVGQPGAGKGRLIAHALRSLKRHHPEVRVWVLDPKQEPDEANHWATVDNITTSQLPAFPTPAEVKAFKEEATEFIQAFKQVTGPKLLVLDEAMAVKEVTGKAWFGALMAGFNSLCSQGRSRREWGWVISQSPNAGDLGVSGGARNVYTRVMLVHSDDRGLLANNSTYFSGSPNPHLYQAESRRVFYLSSSNQWGALPKYGELDHR